MSEIEALTNLISNVGFPIAMCFYLVFKFEKTLKENTEAAKENTTVTKDLHNAIKHWKR